MFGDLGGQAMVRLRQTVPAWVGFGEDERVGAGQTAATQPQRKLSHAGAQILVDVVAEDAKRDPGSGLVDPTDRVSGLTHRCLPKLDETTPAPCPGSRPQIGRASCRERRT